MRLIRLKEVMNLTGLGRSTLYKLMGERSFPQSISLGERAVSWDEREIEEWMLGKIENRNNNLLEQAKPELKNKTTEKDVITFINHKFSQLTISDAITWLMNIYNQ